MEKKKVIKLFGFLSLFVIVFLPGYSKFQELAYKNRQLEEKNRQLEASNRTLQEEIMKLEKDPVYLEKIARDKLKVSKKGEIIYKIAELEAQKPK